MGTTLTRFGGFLTLPSAVRPERGMTAAGGPKSASNSHGAVVDVVVAVLKVAVTVNNQLQHLPVALYLPLKLSDRGGLGVQFVGDFGEVAIARSVLRLGEHRHFGTIRAQKRFVVSPARFIVRPVIGRLSGVLAHSLAHLLLWEKGLALR